MADVVVAGRGGYAGALGGYLREVLPDDLLVVVDPVVRRHRLDAVVVGGQGLVVLHAPPAGAETNGMTPALAEEALRGFLNDEFPGLQPAITFMQVAQNRARPGTWLIVENDGMANLDLGLTLANQPADPDSPLAYDDALREDLAVGLRDRQITARERASEPFVFRSASPLGNAAKTWTIEDTVRHMDRHPEDGIYHLRNGSLAAWLESQGALAMARLARNAVRRDYADPAAQLESFLLDTGLVERPRIDIRPAMLDLGYVVAGEPAVGTLRLSRGRGRGYLFGDLAPCDPWLAAEPRTFTGPIAEIAVRADTSALAIGTAAHEGAIEARTSACSGPIVLPVQLRVVAMPSRLSRYLLRPLAAAGLAGLLGALAGFALDLGAIALPPVPNGFSFAFLAGVFWALAGVIRGLTQPAAWPIPYAAKRWLIRLAAAAVALPALVVLIAWLWARAMPGAGLDSAGLASAALVGLAGAVVPATIAELEAANARARAQRDHLTASRAPTGQQPSRGARVRRLILPVAGLLLIIALIASLPVLRPAVQRADVQRDVASVQSWASDAWSRLDQAVSNLFDRLYLNYYDRRAPAGVQPNPAATPGATPQATGTPPAPAAPAASP